MKVHHFYEVYKNGIVNLIINLPSRKFTYSIRNHEWIDIWDDEKHRIYEIMGENIEDRDIGETEIHITDPEFVKAVENTQMFSSQCKDQVEILYVPHTLFDAPHTTKHFNKEVLYEDDILED